MKDSILKYKELNPNVGFFTLSKIFGISIEEILFYFNIERYSIINVLVKNLIIYDEYNNEIYYETINGYWEKYQYDENGKYQIFKIEYITEYYREKVTIKTKYNNKNQLIYYHDPYYLLTYKFNYLNNLLVKVERYYKDNNKSRLILADIKDITTIRRLCVIQNIINDELILDKDLMETYYMLQYLNHKL